MIWTNEKINALRSQEAKDLAVELQGRLVAKESAPISAGEVQLRELEYELKLKEAIAEDSRQREQHLERLRELELKIEQEKKAQVAAESSASKVLDSQEELAKKVEGAKDALSIQLETATRQHNLKKETLEKEYQERAEALKNQREEQEAEIEKLREEISGLAELQEHASEIKELRETIHSRQSEKQHKLLQLEEEFRSAEFEKTQKINAIRREQEIEVSDLETQHKKDVMRSNQQAAKDILIQMGMIPVKKNEWEKLKKEVDERRERTEQEIAEIREQTRNTLLKEFNITTEEAIDVTEMFYQKQALARQAESLEFTVEKLDQEVRRMREHIEQEPTRISSAVAAAKVQVANHIEQAGKR